MADIRKNDKGVNDPSRKDEDESKASGTLNSRHREESMTEPEKDELDSQNPRSSGTTGLTGESSEGSSVREPGGVEGAGGTE